MEKWHFCSVHYRQMLFIYCKLTTIIILLSFSLQAIKANNTSQVALPNCPEKCGNVSIPYPFGIGKNCHYNPPTDGYYYNLTCNHSTNPPTLMYNESIAITNITVQGEFRISQGVAYSCYSNTLMENASYVLPRFPISINLNYIVGYGCYSAVEFDGNFDASTPFSGCATRKCTKGKLEHLTNNSPCDGIGCCKTTIPNNGITNIDIYAYVFSDRPSNLLDVNPCVIGFVVAQDAMNTTTRPFNQILAKKLDYVEKLKYPVVHTWSIGSKKCSEAKRSGEYLCKGNTSCLDSQHDIPWGYRCLCKKGFRGSNPYLYDCQDIDECAEKSYQCRGSADCVNTLGDYKCSCKQDYINNSTDPHTCIPRTKNNQKRYNSVIVGVAISVFGSLIIAFWFYRQYEKRKIIKIRENFFQENGGLILQEKLSGHHVNFGDRIRMFTIEELKKATNNYSGTSVIGEGGFGIVYKGVLPNNQVIAIKKSMKVNSTQREQFINEIIALSQINNKNIVKLLGCCLETEVPLLVYEYITNGTLHNHLHDEHKVRLLTWDVRLRIATEVAEVLAYLHSTINIPIIHRDVKSMNILLDDNYMARVSDFGASKLVPNEDQLNTVVQGTMGYLDPEYLQTGELTEKSDVYSFGVVLVELLTRQKAISQGKYQEERYLAIKFLQKLKEDRLLDILDENIVIEGSIEQMKEVAGLAKRCLNVKGEDRPTMRQVARELEDIRDYGAYQSSKIRSQVIQKESDYIHDIKLNKNFEIEKDTGNSSSNQSGSVLLMPLNDGR